MWDLLKQADIEQAKQQLKLRRAETLRRQAEESQNLCTDQAELETLNHLAEIFARKFPKPKTLAPEPIAAPVANKNIGYRTSPEARQQNHPDYPRSNFELFARAVSRG